MVINYEIDNQRAHDHDFPLEFSVEIFLYNTSKITDSNHFSLWRFIHDSFIGWFFRGENYPTMGQNLCCMSQPSSENGPKGASTYDSTFCTPASSISTMKTDMEAKQLIRPATKSTLEECLMMASPQVNTGGAPSGDELQVVEMLYQKFHPSSPDVQTDFFTPRISFSSDKLGLLGKIDEEDDEGGSCGGSITPGSHSGKLKKRVRFKLPEAADIIIFYSPKETFEEC